MKKFLSKQEKTFFNILQDNFEMYLKYWREVGIQESQLKPAKEEYFTDLDILYIDFLRLLARMDEVITGEDGENLEALIKDAD